MMTQCPECKSNDIIPDLKLSTDDKVNTGMPAFVKLVEPEPEKKSFMWMAQEVKSTFAASVCGNCGYTRMYAQDHAELLDAHKKGYQSS